MFDIGGHYVGHLILDGVEPVRDEDVEFERERDGAEGSVRHVDRVGSGLCSAGPRLLAGTRGLGAHHLVTVSNRTWNFRSPSTSSKAGRSSSGTGIKTRRFVMRVVVGSCRPPCVEAEMGSGISMS